MGSPIILFASNIERMFSIEERIISGILFSVAIFLFLSYNFYSSVFIISREADRPFKIILPYGCRLI